MRMYPRKIVLEDPKLKKLLVEKQDMILAGREVSQEVEDLEIEMTNIDKEIQELEKTADTDDLKSKTEEITEKFNRVIEEMETVKKSLYERAKLKVPQEIIDKYEGTKKLKEDKEIERNKIALKAQKWTDKIVPIAQKLMKPQLQDEYEDYYGLVLENGEIVGTIFSHRDDFEKRFKTKKSD